MPASTIHTSQVCHVIKDSKPTINPTTVSWNGCFWTTVQSCLLSSVTPRAMWSSTDGQPPPSALREFCCRSTFKIGPHSTVAIFTSMKVSINMCLSNSLKNEKQQFPRDALRNPMLLYAKLSSLLKCKIHSELPFKKTNPLLQMLNKANQGHSSLHTLFTLVKRDDTPCLGSLRFLRALTAKTRGRIASAPIYFLCCSDALLVLSIESVPQLHSKFTHQKAAAAI